MRYIYLLASLFLLSLNTNAQTIIPLEEAWEYLENNRGNTAKHKYYKDVNNILDKYEGTWEGAYNNKKFTFEITKEEGVKYTSTSLTSRDNLLIQYKVTDINTGQVIQDKFDSSVIQLPLGTLQGITANSYQLNYYGDTEEQASCGDNGAMVIEHTGLSLKVHVIQRKTYFAVTEGWVNPCDGVNVVFPFPKKKADALVLTKVTSQQPGLGN